jgi:hypothetical protein
MRDRIQAMLDDLDSALVPLADGTTLDLYHIGRSALVWAYGYQATTRDIDVLVRGEPSGLMLEALRLFGRGSAKSAEHGLYLEAVNTAFPPMAGSHRKRAKLYEHPWNVVRLYHLDPHDLAASKLKRFAARDREDIRELCDRDLIDADELERILELAFYFVPADIGDSDRDGAFANLKVVQSYLRGERDEF